MLTAGVPSMTDYHNLVGSQAFRDMEEDSNQFLKTHVDTLESYAQKWVKDPLHQWSRQWEYPYVDEQVRSFLADRSGNPIRVLDAGSGVTFFPYYLQSNYPCEVKCVDYDEGLGSIFDAINAKVDSPVDFKSAGISALPFEDDSFQFVYCISVLEHTEQYPEIIKEFRRVLAPSGVLVVTFDISIDGDRDIPIEGAQKLLHELNEVFPGKTSQTDSLRDVLNRSDVLTTRVVGKHDRRLLPWPSPLESAWSNVRRLRVPRVRSYPNLSCYCDVYQK